MEIAQDAKKYVTERAVIRLDAEGMRLIEIVPDIDIKCALIPFKDFKPLIGDVQTMPISVFS
jgi:acyl CoA:acetate/3-ketoacid CoA transferase